MRERVVRNDPTIAELKRLGALSLTIFLSDGTERKASLATKGNKWDRLEKLLGSLDWHVIEAYGKGDTLLGRLEAGETETELDTMPDGIDDLKSLAKVMLEVMRSTQRETRLMFQTQMEGQAALVQSMIDGYRAQQEAYSTALRVQSAAQLAGASEGSPEVMQMMQLAMGMMMQPKPPLPPAPTGGAK